MMHIVRESPSEAIGGSCAPRLASAGPAFRVHGPSAGCSKVLSCCVHPAMERGIATGAGKSGHLPRNAFHLPLSCDAPVTGSRRNWHIRNVIGGNSTFAESASDALESKS